MPVRAQDEITLLDYSDGYTVNVNPNVISMKGGVNGLDTGRVFTVNVTVLQGSLPIVPVVEDEDIVCPTNVRAVVGTAVDYSLSITLYFDAGLNSDGSIVIPVKVDNGDIVINKNVSFNLSAKGDTGDPGASISNVENWYLAVNVSSGVTREDEGWTTTVQTMTPEKQFLWNYEKVYDSNNILITATDPVIIGRYGLNGRGISQIEEFYLASSQSSGITPAPPSTGGWSTEVQTTDLTKRYLWNYEKITYSDNTSETTYARIIGTYGDKGDKGDPGEDSIVVNISTSMSTVFKNKNETNTLTALVYKGGTHVDDVSALGTLKWYKDGTLAGTGNTITVYAVDISSKAMYEVKLEKNSEILAVSSIPITFMIDIVSYTRYYYKQNATDTNPPRKPDDADPTSEGWTDSEPGLELTKSLYFVDKVAFSNGTYMYSSVSLSTSYEAAKEAYNLANSFGEQAITAYHMANAKYGTSSSAINLSVKSVACNDFDYFNGALINVLFPNGNNSTALYLSITSDGVSKGVKEVYFNGNPISVTNPFYISPNTQVTFQYTHFVENDAGYWVPILTESILRGLCDTTASVSSKIVVINSGVLHVGSTMYAKFTNGNSVNSPSLLIRDSNGITYCPSLNTDNSSNAWWSANKTISFNLEVASSGVGVCWVINAESFKNSFFHDSDGAHVRAEVGDMNSVWTSDAIEFRDSSTVLAKYGSDSATIGKETNNNVYIDSNGTKIRNGSTVLSEYASDHATIGRSDNDNPNTYIDSTGVNIRKGTTILSRFADSVVELSQNALEATIKMCKGLVQIITKKTVDSGGTYSMLSADLAVDANDVSDESLRKNAYLRLRAQTINPDSDNIRKAYIELSANAIGTANTVINMSANVISINGSSNIQINGPLMHGATTIIDTYGKVLKAVGDEYGYNIYDTYLKKSNGAITNLNQDLAQGFYTYASSATGVPSGAGGTLVVFQTSSTYGYQLAFANSGAGTPWFFYRIRYNSTSFSAWYEVDNVDRLKASAQSENIVFDVSYTPSAANVWDRVGTQTTSKFVTSEGGFYYIYSSSRRSGLGIDSSGSDATINGTDRFCQVDPDGYIRRTGLFFLPTGTYYVYARSVGTGAATIRVLKMGLK